MNLKKYISALALSLVLVLSFAFSAAAATAVDSSADDVITGKITADGTTVTVQVDLAADTGLTNGKVTVTYDTAVYTLESASLGTAAEAADISDLNTENEGTVSAAFAETAGDTDGGTVLTVVLTAASTDDVTTPVTVTLNEAGTADGDVTVAADSFALTAVDKTELQAAVEESGSLEESEYTEESWAAYQEALAAAETVLADEDATQDDVDAAYADLLAAIEALVATETETTEEATTEETTTEEATTEETTTEEATTTEAEEVTTANTSSSSTDETTTTASTGGSGLATGDRNLMPLWIVLAVSLVGAIALAVKGKKQTA
ncbi:MAG: hypothetical protein LUE29_07140 [Lachnospiraceae bacterium]|nr:hypothetical protein [Lachnospiraceae bacterium]